MLDEQVVVITGGTRGIGRAVVMGVAETRMSDALAQFRGVSLEQFRADRPGGPMPVPEDIVPTYVFLASAGADYITGQVIAVDNGRSL